MIVKWLKCHNCGNEWIYSGNGLFYATCPNCYYKVNIKKSTVAGGYHGGRTEENR